MKTIYRIRVRKNRYGISNGPCFVGVHFGKRSLYVGKAKSRVAHTSIKGITDDCGTVSVTTIYTGV